MQDEIRFEQNRHLGLITLTRPQALNALTLSMIKAMQSQLLAWQNDNAIHAVVVQGEGGKAFCAGGDIRWLYDEGLRQSADQMQFFWHEYRLNQFIHHYKKPYIALMDGITMGGGVGISMHGSHPVASEHFRFAMPETSIGFFPDIGASYLLSRLANEAGVYLGLTGDRLQADEALALGLVKAVVAAADFPLLIEALAETDLSDQTSARVEACIHSLAKPAADAAINERLPVIQRCFAMNTVEAILNALQQDPDPWANTLTETLLQKSPTSLKVTLAQLHKAKIDSFDDCLKMDYCLVQHFMRSNDFYEGVRALLIDKDKSPHWHPATLEAVHERLVAGFFECDNTPLCFSLT